MTLDDSLFTPGVLYLPRQAHGSRARHHCGRSLSSVSWLASVRPTADTTNVAGLFSSTADRRHHAKNDVDHVQDREQLLARCILNITAVVHDDQEVGFLVWLPVVWIVGSSGTHAATAPGAETRVG